MTRTYDAMMPGVKRVGRRARARRLVAAVVCTPVSDVVVPAISTSPGTIDG